MWHHKGDRHPLPNVSQSLAPPTVTISVLSHFQKGPTLQKFQRQAKNTRLHRQCTFAEIWSPPLAPNGLMQCCLFGVRWMTKPKDLRSIKDVGALRSKSELKQTRAAAPWGASMHESRCLLMPISFFDSLTPLASTASSRRTPLPSPNNKINMKGQVPISKQRIPLASSNQQMLHYALKCWPLPPFWKSSLFILVPLLPHRSNNRNKKCRRGSNGWEKL